MNKNFTYTLNENIVKGRNLVDYDTLKTEIMNTETPDNVNDEETMQQYMLLNCEYEEYLKYCPKKKMIHLNLLQQFQCVQFLIFSLLKQSKFLLF